MKHWITVPKDKSESVGFIACEDPKPEDFPSVEYMIGPFPTEQEARDHKEPNAAERGFVDPFCNNGEGR